MCIKYHFVILYANKSRLFRPEQRLQHYPHLAMRRQTALPPTTGRAAPVVPRTPFAPPPAPFLPLDIAYSSSSVAFFTGSQITVKRNRGAGEDEVHHSVVNNIVDNKTVPEGVKMHVIETADRTG